VDFQVGLKGMVVPYLENPARKNSKMGRNCKWLFIYSNPNKCTFNQRDVSLLLQKAEKVNETNHESLNLVPFGMLPFFLE